MDNEKIVIFDKYDNAVDANIVKGALEASGISAGVIGDSTANAIWMAPIMVVVFRRDLETAIQALYGGDMNYEEFRDELTPEQFENLQACNKAFAQVAMKCHPEIDNQRKEVYARAKCALEQGNLDELNAMCASL